MKSFDIIETKVVSKAVANNVSVIKPTPLKTPALQTQLKVGKPNDEYEQEADRVADRVMNMPESSIQQQPIEEEEEMAQPKLLIQTQEEEEMIQPFWIQKQGCSSCVEKEIPGVQTAPLALQKSPLNHIESCNGQAMPDSTRGFFESRFGQSFENVKVHTCESAVQMNQQLGAQAFTYGNNVFFNKGKYNPGSSEGKKLLAHELTHVVQQNGGLKRIDKKRQFHVQAYRPGKHNGKQKISSAPRSVQRALPVAAALAIACAAGAIVGMLLDWGIMYGISRWRGRRYRHDWCGTVLAGVLGCLGGISAAAVEAYMIRTGVRIVSGPILGRILTWLVARTAVYFPRQSAQMLFRFGCITEEQHQAITA